MLTRKQELEKRTELTRLKNMLRRSKLRKFRKDIKTNEKCRECGEDNPNLLEFAHYNRSEKSLKFSDNAHINRLKEELKKGRFLCVWCHRLETRKETTQINMDYKRGYTPKEQDMELDEKSKICNGPLCNGAKRHSSFFIKNRNVCKKCRNVITANNYRKKHEYVDNFKFQLGGCELCKIKISKISCHT